jgi:hypothetical protein
VEGRLEVNNFSRLLFQRASCVPGKTPHQVKMIYGRKDWPGLTLWTDSWMLEERDVREAGSKYNVGWLLEARGLRAGDYERSREARNWLNFIMTYDAELLREPGYIKYVKGGIWIPQEDWGLHPKSKFCSFLYSSKTDMPGHHLRHEVARRLKELGGLSVDVFCDIGYSIEQKEKAWKDYAFAIIIEGDRQENLFSEHLLDPLMLGCMPLYWGCPNIDEYLDRRGLVKWETVDELMNVLTSLSMSSYPAFLPALEANQVLAAKYEVTENLMAENIFIPFLRSRGETVG